MNRFSSAIPFPNGPEAPFGRGESRPLSNSCCSNVALLVIFDTRRGGAPPRRPGHVHFAVAHVVPVPETPDPQPDRSRLASPKPVRFLRKRSGIARSPMPVNFLTEDSHWQARQSPVAAAE